MKYIITENRLVDFVDKYLEDSVGRLRVFPLTHINAREGDFELVKDNGETIFTKGSVVVENPGGNVQGQYSDVFDVFFSRYFSQAFLKTSGLYQYFNNPVVYKANLRKGKRSGRSAGLSTGYKWVAGARIGA